MRLGLQARPWVALAMSAFFEQLQQQLNNQVTPHLEKGLVTLGVLSPEDVGDGVGLSTDALTRRFAKEANALKDWKKGAGYLGSCTNPDIAGGGTGAGAAPALIDDTFEMWKKRLEDKDSGDDALAALLQSQALNVVLPSLSSTRNGRTALKDAADPRSARPLHAVLTCVAAVPDSFLERLLQLLVEATEVADQHRDSGMSEEGVAAEQGVKWVQQLLSASFLEATEAAQRNSSSPVAFVASALMSLEHAQDCSSPEEHLDSAESFGRLYNDVKGVCEIFNKPPSASMSEGTERMLKATAEHLPSLAPPMDRIQALKVAKVRKVLIAAAAVAQELQAMLQERIQKARLARCVLPELVKEKHRKGVAALCLEAERVRGRHLEEVHAVLHGALWGPKADSLWQDVKALPVLRYLTNRMSSLVDLAWREMVQLAAEALDDKNALSADSEMVSRSASRYKEMRAELGKNSARLAKMEQAASNAGLKAPASQAGEPSAISTEGVHVADPTPAELTAAAQRQEIIAVLRSTLDTAASSAGGLPRATRSAASSNAPRASPSPAAPAPRKGSASVAPSAVDAAPGKVGTNWAPAANPAEQPKAETAETVKAEIGKYAGAIACFLRYNKAPVFKHWESSQADSQAYWKDKPATEQALVEVSKQARGAFYDAVTPGVTPQSLACGLHRAVARFKLAQNFRQYVQPSVSEVLKRMGSAGVIVEPSGGGGEDYFEACEEHVMTSAIVELQKSKVIPDSFKWVPKPSARFLKLLNAEISKYSGAVAYFMRYETGPLSELWSNARKAGLAYWKQNPCTEVDLQSVAKQAQEGFEAALVDEQTAETLSTALGRAVMRFLLVEKFREFVQVTVTDARGRIGRGTVVEEPEEGASDKFHEVCQAEVLEGVIAELQKANLLKTQEDIEHAAAEKKRREVVEVEAKQQMKDLERQAMERRRKQREDEVKALRMKADPEGVHKKSQEGEAMEPVKSDDDIRERLRPSLTLSVDSGDLAKALVALQEKSSAPEEASEKDVAAADLPDVVASVATLEASVEDVSRSASCWKVDDGRWCYEGQSPATEVASSSNLAAAEVSPAGAWQVSDGRWRYEAPP